jgi:hypothetical protein
MELDGEEPRAAMAEDESNGSDDEDVHPNPITGHWDGYDYSAVSR